MTDDSVILILSVCKSSITDNPSFIEISVSFLKDPKDLVMDLKAENKTGWFVWLCAVMMLLAAGF